MFGGITIISLDQTKQKNMLPNSVSRSSGHPEIRKRVKAIASPFNHLTEKTARWMEEILFMKQECAFLSRLLFQSMSISNGEKRCELKRLRGQFLEFREKRLIPFKYQLDFCSKQLNRQKNKKYPPKSPCNPIRQNRILNNHFKVLNEDFRELKRMAFGEIDHFLKISIY